MTPNVLTATIPAKDTFDGLKADILLFAPLDSFRGILVILKESRNLQGNKRESNVYSLALGLIKNAIKIRLYY